MRRKTGVLAALAIAATCAFSADAFSLQCKETGKQNATVYLRWTSDYFQNEGITYSVYRSEDNTNWGSAIATNIPRLEYFDISPKPGKTYYYKVRASNNAETGSQSIYVNTRNYSHPIFDINTEYEVSLDELLTDGYSNLEGYASKNREGARKDGKTNPDNGKVKSDPKINEKSWQAKPAESDEYDNMFLPRDPSKLSTNIKDIVPDGGKNEDYLFLDGNRYLFVKDGTYSDGTKYYNEIPSFTVTGDILANNYRNLSMSRAAEYYPWAGVGYDWRSADKAANDDKWFHQGHEKCWYIVTRDKQTDKYGVLCVWGPDQFGARPYSGHPLFLDWDKTYYYRPNGVTKYLYNYNDDFHSAWDPNNANSNRMNATYTEANTIGTYNQPTDKNNKFNIDNTYSIAFSDNGTSYVHSTGGVYSGSAYWYMIHTTKIAASRHDWVPSPATTTLFNMHKDGNRGTPGFSPLINVAGNLKTTNRTGVDANDPKEKRTTAWIWMMPNYNGAANTIRVRAEAIYSNGRNSQTNYHRLVIGGMDSYFSGGYKGRENYVIPIGSTQYDVLLQLNHEWIDDTHPNLVYIPLVKSDKRGDSTHNLSDFQTFSLGADYNNTAGGCYFDFNGEKYVVLASCRQGNVNVGDFTIYRVTVKTKDTYKPADSFAEAIDLEPVCNYTSPAIANKQYSSSLGKSANAHRTFIRCFNRKANKTAGIDHDYVEIYVYLPCRTINMYSFYGTTINPATPKVEVVPNVVAEGVPNQWGTERAGDNRHQKITHYDAHTGKTEDRVINDSYAHLKEYYVNYTWNTPFTTATKVRDTKWMVSGFGENAPYYYNSAGSSIAIDDSNFIGAKVNESHNYWNYRGIVQNTVGITARPEFKRYFADNQSVSVWGNVERATDKLNYNPQSVTGLSVKVFVDDKASVNNRARVQNRTLYRVDITFNGASTTAYTDNGKTYNIPATRYEVTRSSKGYNGLLDDSESTAAVMIGSNTHAHWKNATDLPGNVNGYMNLNYAACKEQPSYAYVDGNGNGVNQTANSIVIPGNYFTQNWKNHALPAMGYGSAEGGSEPCVLSFLTTDANAASDIYRVRAIYGTDNWNHTTGYTTINPTSIGVSQYADAEVQPSYIGTTGVDDIAAEGVEETDVEYFNLQGVRVDADNLTPGMYIRRSNLGSRKVVVQ